MPRFINPPGGFQPQQAAADYGRFLHLVSVVDNFGAVVQRAEHEDAGLVGTIFFDQPVHRRHEGAAAGGDDQLVVGHQQPAGTVGHLPLAVDADDADAGVQLDAVLLVPVQRVDENVSRVMGAGQHTGQQDAVVVAAGFLSQHGDVVGFLTAQRHHLFHEAGAGHAIANDHEFLLLCHCHC